ncbi:27759_t:CDS:1, partial [Gigaspora margarita]
KDGSICGKTCTYTTGCTKYRKLYKKNIKLKPCPVSICPRYTDSDTGYCPNHSGRFHSQNYQIRKKYGAEALQYGKFFELSTNK